MKKEEIKKKSLQKLCQEVVVFNIPIITYSLYISLYKKSIKRAFIYINRWNYNIFVGVIDDKYNLNAWVKLFFEIVASLIPIYYGVKVNFITNPKGGYLYLKELSIPFTILWITGITNAINIIDGLDGLASGIVSIVSITLGLYQF